MQTQTEAAALTNREKGEKTSKLEEKNTGRKNFRGNIYCSDVDLSVVPFWDHVGIYQYSGVVDIVYAL